MLQGPPQRGRGKDGEKMGEEGVPPELAMGPGKVTVTAQQDIFASNWFSGHGDLTFLPSH